jgi:hypothetical protein
MKKNCGCSKNLSNYNNIIMSDPNYSTNDDYTNSTTPATPAKPSNKDPSILSYFTEKDLKKEINADMYELGLSYGVCVAISLYNKDQFVTALERGGFLVAGQFIGGFVGNALLNADYFAKGSYSKYKQYVPVVLKIAGATGLYVAGNKQALNSELPTSELALEGALSSTVGHYGSQWMRKKNDKKKTEKLTSYSTAQTYEQF